MGAFGGGPLSQRAAWASTDAQGGGWRAVGARLAVRVPPNTHPLLFATAHQGPVQGVPFFQASGLAPTPACPRVGAKDALGPRPPKDGRRLASRWVGVRRAQRRAEGGVRRGGVREAAALLRGGRARAVGACGTAHRVGRVVSFCGRVHISLAACASFPPPPAAHHLPPIVRWFLWRGPAGGSSPERHRRPSRLRCVRLCERGRGQRGPHCGRSATWPPFRSAGAACGVCLGLHRDEILEGGGKHPAALRALLWRERLCALDLSSWPMPPGHVSRPPCGTLPAFRVPC